MDAKASGIMACFVLAVIVFVSGVLFGNGYLGKEIDPSGFYGFSGLSAGIGIPAHLRRRRRRCSSTGGKEISDELVWSQNFIIITCRHISD